ncbi:hypothetical protein KIN20_007799 [Parelaphostrongylus tenuis]|uniref:Uncharacterized protein n=1 Tax=Parelaphostrongylus tenuis TaxID=148309 RepID=A0AAD5QK90_PARTN|nr:hypothetical protein KIN20_007799 [Parelaphostrongylus tenuis]
MVTKGIFGHAMTRGGISGCIKSVQVPRRRSGISTSNPEIWEARSSVGAASNHEPRVRHGTHLTII